MELVTQSRTAFGKATTALRRAGLIPAELYGHGISNVHLAVLMKDFKKVFAEAGEHTVLTLLVGNEKRPALVHDVVRDYLTNEIAHIDFYQVRMDEKIHAPVPITFVGEAPAIKTLGGILNRTITEIEVEALPAHLPHGFTVDLGLLLELNQSIYVRDLEIPHDVKVLVDPETVIVSITPPRAEEEVLPPPATVDVSQVKVESEEKKAERDKEKEQKAEV